MIVHVTATHQMTVEYKLRHLTIFLSETTKPLASILCWHGLYLVLCPDFVQHLQPPNVWESRTLFNKAKDDLGIHLKINLLDGKFIQKYFRLELLALLEPIYVGMVISWSILEVYPMIPLVNQDWLIDWFVLYATLAVFQPYRGENMHNIY